MDVFISYRREGGYAMARLLYECFNKDKIFAFINCLVELFIKRTCAKLF